MEQQSLHQQIDQAEKEQWEELDLSGWELTELPPEIGKLTQLKRLVLGKWDEGEKQWIGIGLQFLPREIEQLSNLTELTLSGNQLITIPECVTNLAKLEILHLACNQISEIAPSISILTNLTKLSLAQNQISEIPDCIAQLTNLTKLYLWGNQISEIPDCIAQLTNLTKLYLSQNQISEIPDCIAQLTNLTELHLYQNQISEIPDCIAQLTNLTTLSLPQNQISEIPDCIAQLTNLAKLNLWGNQISEIPDCIAQLTNLTELYLSQNQISEIPDCIAQLTNLTEVNLSQNQISEIPDCIAQLTNLTELYLSQNQISEIPDCIAQLTNLAKLNLWGNQISEIPNCIAQLTNLTELYLSRNQIGEIPNCIAQLTNLTTLNLAQNQIGEIPDCIAQLTNLTTLNLAQNQISEIPNCIAQLTNLTELYLWGNQISEIPNCIAQLTNLTTLSLPQNQISEIPDCIAQLTNLTELNLWGNQISEIPNCIAQLTNLTKLYLSQNQISEIPDCIAQLTNLSTLNLAQNQISEIPGCIAQLTNLTTLYLNRNQISKVPEYIDKLPNLNILGLGQNGIRELPRSLEKLEKLSLLQLNNNPLSIPPETLRQGWGNEYNDPGNPQAILNYYFTTRDPNQTQTLYEIKLLLVGEGGSGKTSLANKLLHPDYQLKTETEDTSTKGIDILKWEFTSHDGNSYRISIWDFGGQEIYHQTHQFFLTERSLYLLVADSRKEDTDHYFWLKSIQLLSNSSPVILIQNEKQNRTCNLNANQLRGEFANLRDTYRINLFDNRGLAELQSAIKHELEKLIPNGIPFPNKWLAVRYALANDGRNYIDCTTYEETCRRHGITTREEMFQLSQFLHELGICLHFQKDPILCNRLLLKANWGTDAVYKILDNDTVKQNLGQFSDADLADIWAAPEYSDMRHQLLQLMKEFKVCYEIPRRKGQYIAPHLLSADSPAYAWQSENNLILRYRYKVFMPKGILTRFIVERHQDIENVSDPEQALVWKSGVVLTNGAARAQVIEDYPRREISIHVSGNRPRDLLTIINDKFQEIHDSFDNRLDYDTLIPCNCPTCKPSQTPFTFPLNRLHQCIDQRRQTIECHESGKDVNVRSLIDGVINEAPDYPELLEDGDREDFTGEPARHRSEKQRRNRLQPTRPPQNPTVSVSLMVPINNNNQQDQDMSNDKIWNGDRIEGDKFGGDKIAGNKLQAGTVHGDAVAGNKNVSSPNLAQAAQDIKTLLDQLAVAYPTEDDFTRAGRAVGAIKNNPTLKQRVTNALKESGTTAVEKAIEAVTDNPAVSIIVAGVKGFVAAEGNAK